MKIDKLATQHTNKMIMNTHDGSKNKRSEVKGENNFDKVTISGNSKQIMEKQFSEYITNKIIEEVKKPTSSEKLHEIEEAIAQGRYEINPHRIAGRIIDLM